MKIILTRTLTIIFFILAMIHFYWAIGGQWGFENALATNEQGIKILNPKTIDSAIVGILLLLFGLFYLFFLNFKKTKTLILIQNIGVWIIPILFAVRAIGDFKYVGFFKKIKGTVFSDLDTMFYSPLCLTVGLIGILLIKLGKEKSHP